VLVWRRLNSIYPRRLWAMTVEGLRGTDESPSMGKVAKMGSLGRQIGRKCITEDDLVLDPLYVLRCDQRVFR